MYVGFGSGTGCMLRKSLAYLIFVYSQWDALSGEKNPRNFIALPGRKHPEADRGHTLCSVKLVTLMA